MIGEIQRNAPVAVAHRLDPDPRELACCGDGIEIRGVVDIDARRQNLGFEERCREGRALQLFDRVKEGVGAVPPLHDPLPRRRQPAENRLIDRFDFVPQLREGAAAQNPQDAGVGPFVMGTAGTEFAFDETALHGETRQHRFGRGLPQTVTEREVGRGERCVSARISQREIAKRIANRLQQRFGHAEWQGDAQRVAVPCRVLDGDISHLASDPHPDRAATLLEKGDRRRDLRRDGPGANLLASQIAESEEHVVHRIGAPCVILRVEPLDLQLDGVHRLGVEQLA